MKCCGSATWLLLCSQWLHMRSPMQNGSIWDIVAPYLYSGRRWKRVIHLYLCQWCWCQKAKLAKSLCCRTTEQFSWLGAFFESPLLQPAALIGRFLTEGQIKAQAGAFNTVNCHHRIERIPQLVSSGCTEPTPIAWIFRHLNTGGGRRKGAPSIRCSEGLLLSCGNRGRQ